MSPFAAALLFALSLPASAATIEADVQLIKRLGPGAYRNEPFIPPYIALFQRGQKLLIFVSGDHGKGINSTVAKSIRHAFKRYKPQALIVEGLSSDAKNDALDRLRQAKAFAAKWPDEFPENYYPIFLADRAGLPFVGGEPGLAATRDALRPLGYEAEDLLGLTIGSNVGALTDECAKDRDKCAKMLDGMAARSASELGIPGAYDFAEFERWFVRRAGLSTPAHKLTAKDCMPFGGQGATYLQTVAYQLELIRESAIVRQMDKMLNSHDRVLIVYGSGHLVRQREVWKTALGPSKDLKPF